LAAHEERLREAKQTADFSKVLDEYQSAQDKIEKDLEKQRAKEAADLQRRLKNRRNKAKSEKELKVQDELRDLEDEKEADLAGLKHQKKQIEAILQKDAAPADNQGGNMGRHRPDGESTTSPRLAQQLAEQQQKATAEKATLDEQQQKKFRDFAAQADRETTTLNKDAEQARQEALEEAKTGAVKAATAI